MGRLLLGFLIVLFFTGFTLTFSGLSYAQQEEEVAERLLVLREAKEFRKSTVAVEGYLMDNVLEVKIIARMYQAKPKIHNAIIVGPRLGRLSCESKEPLLATVEEEEPYPTKRKDKGFISFGKDQETKKAKGTLTREVVVFRIPRDRVVQGKKYRLWVQIESLQRGGKYKTYKFDLENFAELLSK